MCVCWTWNFTSGLETSSSGQLENLRWKYHINLNLNWLKSDVTGREIKISVSGFKLTLCWGLKRAFEMCLWHSCEVTSWICVRRQWFPYRIILMDKIESIQKTFVMYALRELVRRNGNSRLPPFKDRCAKVGIEPLSVRRMRLCVFFVFDLLKGNECTTFCW